MLVMDILEQKVVEVTIATNAAKSGPVVLQDGNGTLITVLEGKIKITGDNIQIRHNGTVVPNDKLAETQVKDGDTVMAIPQVKAG
jgi:hypothetical protein